MSFVVNSAEPAKRDGSARISARSDGTYSVNCALARGRDLAKVLGIFDEGFDDFDGGERIVYDG
jgi:hypothetical protein